MNLTLCSELDLRQFVCRILAACGVSQGEARDVATSLVDAELCGHESHGVMRVAEYVEQLRGGALVSDAKLDIRHETPAAVFADACLGFGQVQMRRLIDHLLPKAAACGVAAGTLMRCGHVGRLGEWVERIAGSGMASMVCVNDNGVLTCVAPPGGIDPRISTNPIAIGAPGSEGPVVLDISTSAVANGKIRVAQLARRLCPDGWLQAADGRSTNDPSSRFSEPPATILPMGGDQGFKGFGLGLLLDILVGGLSGGFCPPAVPERHDE